MKIILIGLLGIVLTACSPNQNKNITADQIIDISAKRFEFTPNIIKAKKGETITLRIDNQDTSHGITIPELGVKGKNELTFIAEKTGAFEFRCATPCGNGHRTMKGTIMIE